MDFKVKQFPIFHRYLASILLEVKLAEGSFAHVLDTVGEFSLENYCRCGDPLCSTVKMTSTKWKGRNETFAFAYKTGWIIISFYGENRIDVESLADSEKFNYPFRSELRHVFDGKELKYDDAYAEKVVEDFMIKLERCDVERVEV